MSELIGVTTKIAVAETIRSKKLQSPKVQDIKINAY